MATVVQIRWGQPTVVQDLHADLYWACRPWLEHDAARQARVAEEQRAAGTWNEKKRTQYGTMATMQVAAGTGMTVGKGGKARKAPKHGVGR